ncbi:variant erythrocyte surface antigen-1 beta subunit [Babesia bovis T2Bo]|uniref:Variant erythrocyte surface antigen-1, beta subunit n=1 Tax=Babesia bovis TaxID=5865 RepID=A7AM50_BABBO|nr:variant erythrocyte surface antigen-1 beta subunit [Babesia bovis T2Bo]EDO07634.1 variant erythrocyte surface antigen-1 beta subunit [Babesia bovis T2Bo]|eukprot:XP_001611202.1 variant erythrocyte surface antigen-1, beta subunit [Babesia bovis T2Bo]
MLSASSTLKSGNTFSSRLGSDSTTSATTTCAGGTEVIRALIDQLALGLQKWVGWQEGDKDVCCLKGTDGIGRECKCPSGGATCCNGGSGSSATPCHQCDKCGTSGKDGNNKCYLSAYNKENALWTKIVNGNTGKYPLVDIGSNGVVGSASSSTVDTVRAAQDVHLLARIFLGSVCLIWSGLSQLGFLTGGSGGTEKRWSQSSLHEICGDSAGLGSFMAAMGYDLERLNGSGGPGKAGTFVNGLLTKTVEWKDLSNGTNSSSVAEYYSIIYKKAEEAGKSTSKTEQICEQYPLLVLHILASGYFRAGSAGAKGVIPAPSAPQPAKAASSDTKKDDAPRKPRTIREILYWLSALPYSPAYKGLLGYGKERLERILKRPYGSSSTNNETQLKFYQDKRPHPITVDEYNLFAHFQAVTQYCPLVLIGIQGGLKGTDSTKEPAIHDLYANTECNFTYPTVPIQAYNQVVHYIRGLFYQLYFLRKQCAVKVAMGGKWRECRYGTNVVSKGVISWMCLGCDPMEHDRKSRVDKVKEGMERLVGVMKKFKKEWKGSALERRKEDLTGVKTALNGVFKDVYQSGSRNNFKKVIEDILRELAKKVKALEKVVNGLDKLNGATKKAQAALTAAQEALYGVQGMNSELDGEMGKGALEMGRLGVITAIHAPQGAILTKLDHSLRNLHGIFI